MMVNFHQIALMSSNLLRINTAPGTKNIPMLSMKNLLTWSTESTLIKPIKRKMNNSIIPINDPGKLTLTRLSKYEINTPNREKAMINTSCLNTFICYNIISQKWTVHLNSCTISGFLSLYKLINKSLNKIKWESDYWNTYQITYQIHCITRFFLYKMTYSTLIRPLLRSFLVAHLWQLVW